MVFSAPFSCDQNFQQRGTLHGSGGLQCQNPARVEVGVEMELGWLCYRPAPPLFSFLPFLLTECFGRLSEAALALTTVLCYLCSFFLWTLWLLVWGRCGCHDHMGTTVGLLLCSVTAWGAFWNWGPVQLQHPLRLLLVRAGTGSQLQTPLIVIVASMEELEIQGQIGGLAGSWELDSLQACPAPPRQRMVVTVVVLYTSESCLMTGCCLKPL